MRKIPKFWGLHAKTTTMIRIVAGILPFLILFSLYFVVSHFRLEANPSDKLTPSISKMVDAVDRMAFQKDKRSGEYLLWSDTAATLKRIVVGLGLAAIVGLMAGVHIGLLPGFEAIFSPFVRFAAGVSIVSLLPIIFIVFGVDEFGKIVLIYLGSVVIITRDIYNETKKINKEMIVKVLTLGASQFQVLYEVVLPLIIPRLIITVRICLGGAWVFALLSEAIASSSGLGYRIFLVRRYLSMDIIIPYVIWITLIIFVTDHILRRLVEKKFSWYIKS